MKKINLFENYCSFLMHLEGYTTQSNFYLQAQKDVRRKIDHKYGCASGN